MDSIKKRKLDDAHEHGERYGVCIIHMKDSTSDAFTFIVKTKDPAERFQRIKDIKKLRLSQALESPYRMSEACEQIPDTYSDHHGYHRDCYARFTSNLKRLEDSELPSTSNREPRRSSLDKEKTIFKPDCIFCRKEGKKSIKVRNAWTTEVTRLFARGGGVSVEIEATKREDYELLRRISGFDLFACEARYHPSCQRKYKLLSKPEMWRSKNEEQAHEQAALEDAHKKTFDLVCEVITDVIINNEKILKLSELRDLYVSHLQSTPFANPDYRSENLKLKLERHKDYQEVLGFCPVKSGGKFQSYLVFNTKTDLRNAISASYLLGRSGRVKDLAGQLKNEVVSAFKKTDDIPWPLLATDLSASIDRVVPSQLKMFLSILLSQDRNNREPSKRVLRLVNSIGQDICRAVTNGRWKMPKHVLLGMTLRHLFRSADLIRLLNRLGQCENYSFLLELETAIAQAVENTSSLLPVSIIRNPACPFLFHSDFDNFDEFINDLSGAGSVHRSHGIMLQEICGTGQEVRGTQPELPALPRTGQRSFNPGVNELEECYVGKRQSPHYEIKRKAIDGAEKAQHNLIMKNMIWLLLRLHCATQEQTMSGWAGYVSSTGDVPHRLTTVDYFPVIPFPITDNKAVKECLRFSEEASLEVGQKYVITSFDLGVCMKAYPLVWNYQKRYENHIIMIGTFHLACSYLKMIGKKMECSGLSDVLLEAGLISPGSLTGVLSGKSYARAIHCHKVMVESLERLLLEQFKEKTEVFFINIPQASKDLLNELMKSPSKENETVVLADLHLVSYIERFLKFRENVRTGVLGKTATFWMSYMDHVWLTLNLLQAVKTNDFLAYSHCLCLMPDIFFSFGGQNYARYMAFFSMFITNIETSHPGATELLRRGAFSVARSFIPGNRCEVDKTMEETFMKQSKSRGGSGSSGAGLTGLQTNYGAYQRWTRSASERAKYLQATYSMADMVDDQYVGKEHRDNRNAEKLRSERHVSKTVEAIQSFNDPFAIADQDKVYCISSGAPASAVIEVDILRADSVGRASKESFITNRLEAKENFFEPIKRLNLKTMSAMHTSVKVTSSKNKTIVYKQQGNVAFQLLVKSQQAADKMDLRKLLTYPLVPVPYSIGLPDNFLAKTDKAKGLHYLIKDLDDANIPEDPKSCLVIEDGNAIFHYIQEIPRNFEEISEMVLKTALQNSPVIFSTDMYQDCSVKGVERKRRGTGEKLIVRGEKTRRPKDWKDFLTNDENKEQLIRLLLSTWSKSFSHKLEGHEVTLICEGRAYQLTSDGESTLCQEIASLASTQEETDSRVILYCHYAKEKGFKFVRVRSPDSDIFFILLKHAHELQGIDILFETGKGNKKRRINIGKLAQELSPLICDAFLGLHAFTGCDSTSAFRGKGKVKALKIVQKSKHFQKVFSALGESWEVTTETLVVIEEFTCALYGNRRIKTVNELRHSLLLTKCGGQDKALAMSSSFDLSALPPCNSCLLEHLNRANYQVGIWKRAHIAKPDIPHPLNGHGWTRNENGEMIPKWTNGEIMPVKLVDVLEATLEVEDESEDDEQFHNEELSSDSNDDSE